MFRRVLVANRGEIALRVIRACRELGVESVAVYSDADSMAPHALDADRAVRIGPAPPADSYLRVASVIEAARSTGAEAVHPGYGFLSENPALAHACQDAGLTFIGPPPSVLETLGSKIAARTLAARAGVAAVPGKIPATQSDEALAAAAAEVGFPILLKPASGGGGIGMKRVADAAGLAAAAAQARREARAAFGDDTLYVERALTRPRHVEVQIFGDSHGHVVHLFERECSLQRRHQKLIEESPSVALTPALRERMGAAAVAVATEAGYRNAGTVEFLLDGTGDDARFYFLEVNARLQVEHPVTELVAGVDLVHAQLRVAAGEPLPWTGRDLAQRGHAIEARVYAEDPEQGHLPQAGRLLLYREPRLPGVRIDSGVREQGEISVHYDPLLSKVIAWGETRDAARRRAIEALRRYPILGVRTNVRFLLSLLDSPRFVAGDIDVGLVESEAAELAAADTTDWSAAAGAIAAVLEARSACAVSATTADPWTTLGAWRG